MADKINVLIPEETVDAKIKKSVNRSAKIMQEKKFTSFVF